MTAEDILATAADLVEQGGWTQAEPLIGYEHGPYCAGVALNKAAREALLLEAEHGAIVINFGTPETAVTRAWAAFCREIGVSRLDNIPMWNDMPGRCKEEVVAGFRNAKRWL